jgi:ATP-binding cassette, subfamily B, bacterial PglK
MKAILADIRKLERLLGAGERSAVFGLLFVMLAGALVESLSVAIVPVFIAFVMDPSTLSGADWLKPFITIEALPSEPSRELLIGASLALIVVVAVKNSFLGVVFWLQATLVNKFRVVLSTRVFELYQNAPYEWHLQHNSAELLRNIREDVNQIINHGAVGVLDMLLAGLMSLGMIAVLFYSSTPSSLGGIAVMGVGLLAITRLFRRSIGRLAKVLRREAMVGVKAIQQGIGSLVDTRLSGRQYAPIQVFEASMLRMAKALVRESVIKKLTPYLIEMWAVAGLLLVLMTLLLAFDSFQSLLPTLGLFGVVAMRLKQTTSTLTNSYLRLVGSRPFLDGILADIDELEGQGVLHKPSQAASEKFESVAFDDVSYRYPEAEKNALDNISLKIQAGQSVAFVGKTGGGKSTLLHLLLGLLEPQSGALRVNDKTLGSDKSDWWSHVGYVPQHIFLVDDSIAANVALGIEEQSIEEERVWEALRIARLDDYIRSLPDGLNTVVGERGVRLSGGQRQRLGIARAIYDKPSVLFLDEATSALDGHTEELLVQSLEEIREGLTLIVVAHRMSTIEQCDCIYLVEEGGILASGSYQELTEESERFREISRRVEQP